jgi:hypothetical protein
MNLGELVNSYVVLEKNTNLTDERKKVQKLINILLDGTIEQSLKPTTGEVEQPKE